MRSKLNQKPNFSCTYFNVRGSARETFRNWTVPKPFIERRGIFKGELDTVLEKNACWVVTIHLSRENNVKHQSARKCTSLQQVPPISTKLHQTAPICTKLYDSAPSYTKLHQSALSWTNCRYLHQVAPHCIKLHRSSPSCANWTKLHQAAPSCNKLHQTAPS